MRHEAERETYISQHDIISARMYLVLVVGFVSLMVLFPTLYVRVYIYVWSSHIAEYKVCINRVRLPILLVVS